MFVNEDGDRMYSGEVVESVLSSVRLVARSIDGDEHAIQDLADTLERLWEAGIAEGLKRASSSRAAA